MSKLQFKVRFKAKIGDNELSGVEDECSYYSIDQSGNFYESSPMQPILPVGPNYTELEALIKVGEEYLTVAEIESRIKPL